jgi:hypothetical protein
MCPPILARNKPIPLSPKIEGLTVIFEVMKDVELLLFNQSNIWSSGIGIPAMQLTLQCSAVQDVVPAKAKPTAT